MTEQSLSSPTKLMTDICIYYNPKPTIRVVINYKREEIQNLSLKQILIKSLKTLKEDYFQDIHSNNSCFSLYPANRTGSRKDGYPELSLKINANQINLNRFYLENNYKANSLISTEFNLEKKYGFEKKPQFIPKCCSLFGH